MNSVIKIGFADDHPIFRRGLRDVINLEDDFEVIWEVPNGQEVLHQISKDIPDVILLDIDMPIIDGIEAAMTINLNYPDIEMIFLTMHKDTQLFDSMKKFDVKGYILKDSAVDEIVECIKKVSQGITYMTPELTELLLGINESKTNPESSLFIISNLTSTEKNILKLISESNTSKEIAKELYISTRTVENHRYNISKKLHLKGNHALLKFVISNKDAIQNLLS